MDDFRGFLTKNRSYSLIKVIAKTIKLPILLSLSDIENPFILTPQLYRQDFEKSLHNFK